MSDNGLSLNAKELITSSTLSHLPRKALIAITTMPNDAKRQQSVIYSGSDSFGNILATTKGSQKNHFIIHIIFLLLLGYVICSYIENYERTFLNLFLIIA
jgi:hypothetical protein